MILKCAWKAKLTDSTVISENGGPSSDGFVGDLYKRVHGSSSAKDTLSKTLPKMKTEALLKKLLLHMTRLNEACRNREL